MKKITATLILLIGIIAFSACEKDDICVDGDTPLLIIRFYDVADTTETKEVPGLQVNGLLIGSDTLETIANASGDSIAIPLRLEATSTSFLLAQRQSEEDSTNFDILTFDYTVQEEFFSRACGFVARFDGLAGAVTSEADSLWIKDIQIVTPFVENSLEAHVKIFH